MCPTAAPGIDLGLGAADTLVEWGGALRWVKAPAQLATRLREAAGALGGSATLFRRAADPTLPEPAVFHPLTAPLMRIHRDLKRQLDPAGIFNRARIYADL